MKYFFILCAIFTTTIPSSFGDEEDLKIIKEVNSAKTTWKAAENYFTHLTDKEKKCLVGSRVDLRNVPTKKFDVNHLTGLRIPKTFDARKKWKNCPSLWAIKDQGLCSGCWAVSSASVMSDRLCITSKYKVKVNISAEEIISCCTECGGCEGGNVDKAWLYFIREGVVTGGDYGSKEGCKPFSTKSCGTTCKGEEALTPACVKKHCTNSHYHNSFKRDLHFGNELYTIPLDVKAIQKEIFYNGPVVATFSVYRDFYFYKSGVYQYVTGNFTGRHAVRLLGWGTENRTNYWLVANSWSHDWGENGLFKIRRGTNEVTFEDTIVAGSTRKR